MERYRQNIFSALAKSLNTFKEFDFFNGPFKDKGYAIQRTVGQYYHGILMGVAMNLAQDN